MSYTVYMGYDPREVLAFDVARKSLLRRTDPEQVQVRSLKLGGGLLRNILTRPVEQRGNQLWCPISDAPMATAFAISRFAVPLVQPDGWAVFMDCDVLVLADIRELFALADERYAVQVVKHNHQPAEALKMDGQQQTVYQRKNWSSVILWNCGHEANRRLTRELLNTAPGRDLHAFCWLKDDEIGELPREWNHLVGVSEPCQPKLAHYTLGGPWFRNWPGGPLDNLWLEEAAA